MIERTLHCWHGENDDNEIGSDEWMEVFVRGEGTCMLEHGHGGPHVYTPDDEFVIVFAAKPVADGRGDEGDNEGGGGRTMRGRFNLWRFFVRVRFVFTGKCGLNCGIATFRKLDGMPFQQFVPEADCPVHDVEYYGIDTKER